MKSIKIICAAAFLVLSLSYAMPARALDAATPAAAVETSSAQPSSPTASAKTNEASKESADADSEVNVYRHSAMVQSLAHTMGMSTEKTARIFEVANFLILAFAVLWFVAKALPKALRGRSARIQKNIVDARQVTDDANRRLQDVEQRLSKLDTVISSMKAQAERETTADEARIRATMDEERARLVHAAEQEIASVGANAQRRLKTLAADLILDYAAHHVSLDANADRAIVQSFVAELGSKSRKGMN